MKWTIITDDLQIRLEGDKPEYYSREQLPLEEVVQVVRAWVQGHPSPEAEDWLEAADEELDLRKRTWDSLQLLRLFDIEATWDEARRGAICARDLERGEKALKNGDYAEALGRLQPLAESGLPRAQFCMGVMFAAGRGVALDNVEAYIWLDLAARAQVTLAAEARDKIAERLSAEGLAEAQRRATDKTRNAEAQPEAAGQGEAEPSGR